MATTRGPCLRASSARVSSTLPVTIWPSSRWPSCRKTASATRRLAMRATCCPCCCACGPRCAPTACVSSATRAGSTRAARRWRCSKPSSARAGARGWRWSRVTTCCRACSTHPPAPGAMPICSPASRWMRCASGWCSPTPTWARGRSSMRLRSVRTSSSPAVWPMPRSPSRPWCTAWAGGWRTRSRTRTGAALPRGSPWGTGWSARGRAAAATSARRACGRRFPTLRTSATRWPRWRRTALPCSPSRQAPAGG